MIGGIEINDRIKFSINNYNEYEKLNEIIQSCKYFSSAQLSELAIKGLLKLINPQAIVLKIYYPF